MIKSSLILLNFIFKCEGLDGFVLDNNIRASEWMQKKSDLLSCYPVVTWDNFQLKRRLCGSSDFVTNNIIEQQDEEDNKYTYLQIIQFTKIKN